MEDVTDRPDGGRRVDMAAVFRALPTAYTLLAPDLTVLDVNAEFLRLTGRERHEVLGRDGFEVYPTFPGTLVDGQNPLRELFDRVLDSGRAETVPLLRYDVAPTARAGPQERWWSLACSPLLDDAGAVEFLLFHVEDVSAYVLHHQRGSGPEADPDPALGARLFARLEAGRVAQLARVQAARRLSALAGTALRLASARTVADVVRAAAAHALASTGADAASIAVPGGDGWRLVGLGGLSAPGGPSAPGGLGGRGGDLQRHHVPFDSPLPVCVSARTGERILLPDAAAVDARHPVLAALRTTNGRRAWAALPLAVEGRVIGGMSAGWSRDHPFTEEDLELLDGCAAQCAQALERIVGERSAAEEVRVVRRLSETLQRSLLTRPPVREGLQLAMRYQPAARGAEVGGDWFDAFATRSGGTVLVVGDVVGHDQVAAAAMGQVRNMVRGIAFDGDDRPATLLARLDQAMAGLELGALATAVLAVVDPPLPGVGSRRLRWTNAGHLPPLLRRAGGRVEVLDTSDDMMLGIDATSLRHEHVVALEPGDVLVLYTDGLVERRGQDLDDGIAGVRATLQARDVFTAQGWADSLLTTMRASGGEDDTALLVVHVEVPATAPAPSPDAVVDVVLPADPRSVRDARRLTQRCCHHHGVDADTTETVVLLTSELVTNAVVHGRSEVRLRVSASPASVRVEVADDNDRVPVLQTHDDEALSGRGISLLEVAATRWGVEEAPIGKVVWFSLDVAG